MIRLDTPITDCTILMGPPNFGMIGTIVTEFLISHLKMRSCGSLSIDGLPPVIAIHQGALIEPIGLFHDPVRNILLVHIAANVVGREQEIALAINQLFQQVRANRLISVDGLFDDEPRDIPNVWFVSRDATVHQSLVTLGMEPLSEGIVTGPNALLLANPAAPITVLLASSHAQIADSAAAASIVAALDEWLSLGVDSSQLLSYVEQFEEKWRSILSDSEQVKEEKEKKYVSYVG